MNQSKLQTTDEKVQSVVVDTRLSGINTLGFAMIMGIICGIVVDIDGGLRDWYDNSGSAGPALFFCAVIIPAIILTVITSNKSRERYKEMFSTINSNFWRIPAEAKIERLVMRVESMELSESARAKFTGEIKKIHTILTEEIPTLIGEIHAQASNYSETGIDHNIATMVGGILENTPFAQQLHYRCMVLSMFYYKACNQLAVMGSKTVVSLEDIDNELSDIIDAWGKIEKE